MKRIDIKQAAGTFAENKDAAQQIRKDELLPELAMGNHVVIDFDGVTLATQSFIHALISEPIRKYGIDVLDKIYFKDCNGSIQTLINVVSDYMQESLIEE